MATSMNLTNQNRTGCVLSESDKRNQSTRCFMFLFIIALTNDNGFEVVQFLHTFSVHNCIGIRSNRFFVLVFIALYLSFRRLMAPNLFTIIFWQMTDTQMVSFVYYYSTHFVRELQWISWKYVFIVVQHCQYKVNELIILTQIN